MADVGSFLVGAVIGTAGVFLLPVSGPAGMALISIGVGLVTKGLFGVPQFQEGIKTNVTGTQEALPVVYGRAIVGHVTADVRQDLVSNDTLYVVGAICVGSENGQGIENVEYIYFNDDIAIGFQSNLTFPNNTINGTDAGLDEFYIKGLSGVGTPYVGYNLHAGTDAQTVDLMLNDEFADAWPSTSTGKGIAYATLALKWDDSEQRIFGGIPTITYRIQGNRVYDPRFPTNGPNSDGFVWDAADTDSSLQAGVGGRVTNAHPGQNPALVLYDYLRSVRYGIGLSADRIDTQSFIDQANYCDEEVSIPDGDGGTTSQCRYRCNGALSTAESHKNNVEKILTSMNANIVWAGGKVSLMPLKPQTAEAFELTDDNILGQISVVRSGVATPNTVRARFPDAEEDFNTMEVVWPEPGTNDYLTADNNWESDMTLDLPMTTNWYNAQHLAMVALRELREDVTIELEATEEAMVLQPGHVVNVTYDTAGWTQKTFRVVSLKITEVSTVKLQMREYDNGVYSLDPLDDKPTVPGTNLPNPFEVTPPTGVAIDCDRPVTNTLGELIPGVLVTWTHSTDQFAEWEEPLYKEFTAVDWIHTGRRVLMNDDAEALLTETFEIGKTYHFAVVTYNHLGRASSIVVGPSCQITEPDGSDVPGEEIDATLNCEFTEGTGNGSYWATLTGSTGVANSSSPTVSSGCDFIFDNNGETVTIVQVDDAGGDITKAI